MFLSKVEIDRQNRQKNRNLSHIGAFHHWVEQSFPQEIEENTRTRKLWRIDKLRGKEYLLVVSSTKPDLSLLEKYGIENSAQTKDYDPFLNMLEEGIKARFRITLNPVISIKDSAGKRGRVVPLAAVDKQLKFLYDRAEKNGFSLKEDDFTIVDRGYSEFKKSVQKPIKLSKVIYEGILTITNVDLFIKTLTEGIGKKKAYGFGLMTVIPLVNEK